MTMFRIRRVYDTVLPINRSALEQVKEILAEQFDELPSREIETLEEKIRNPFSQRLVSVLAVAENRRRKVLGFAIVLHDPELDFCFLDFVASGKGLTSRGVGGSLYEWVRDQAFGRGCRSLLFECPPDELPEGTPEEVVRANASRLRFYESYGARPIVGTAYETPVSAGDTSPMPYLVLDLLGAERPPEGRFVRKAVRAILERKYAHLCPPEYVDRVVRSFPSGEVTLRDFRYVKSEKVATAPAPMPRRSPVRIPRILEALEPTGWFVTLPPREHSIDHINAVHSPQLVAYLRRACEDVEEGRSLYPYVFPVRNRTRRPRERSVLAGYFCIDTFTPIHRNSFRAAKRAVDCTLTSAGQILEGERLAYSLVRPPGHHAEHECFGGFCYFNNAAVAAHFLSRHGRVAILDVDYHHGNGQQDIFYRRADVLTVSIHGDPRFAYPYFCGFEDEIGEGEGEGFNLNLALPERQDGKEYRRALRRALERVRTFAPDFLIVALGLDTAKGDPTGTWSLTASDFERNARLIAELDLPLLVVQEGGYRTRTLGSNARAFFRGLIESANEKKGAA
jgi:acetoin utilization deacetylase AcuC-like enzyme